MNYKQPYPFLSDLFTLYYKGTDALRQGVIAPAGPPIYDQRWVIFSEFFGFLYSNGNYQPPDPWMPDHPAAWENIKEDYDANSNPTGRSYDTRFMGFAEFWYNRLYNLEESWINKKLGLPSTHQSILVALLLSRKEVPSSFIKRFKTTGNFKNGDSEDDFVTEQINTCLDTIFLPYVKAKLNL